MNAPAEPVVKQNPDQESIDDEVPF
jgi:hypothetical protein